MKNLTNIKERILYFIDNQNIKISKFYSESGVSYGILTQKSKITEDNIVKFLTKYSQVNSEWLLTGKGEMLKSDSTEVKKEVISSAEERVDRLLSIIESQQEVIKNLSEALIEADAQKECGAECAGVG